MTQQQGQAFGGLFNAMAIAVLLVYVMMVLAFNSLVTPFVIMFSLPLAAIGVFPALLLSGRAIGISALIGILMLIGIVVTNAIVLLDLVERLRRQGMSTTEALVEGGKTRVRPILMTAIATILALIPLAAGFNQGSIIAAELGTVVIGGLFSSTFLTLIVVPVVYSLVDSGKTRLGRRRSAAHPGSAGRPDPRNRALLPDRAHLAERLHAGSCGGGDEVVGAALGDRELGHLDQLPVEEGGLDRRRQAERSSRGAGVPELERRRRAVGRREDDLHEAR